MLQLNLIPGFLFSLGLFMFFSKKNIISSIIAIEIMINAAIFNFLYGSLFVVKNISGQVFSLFVMLVAVAEAVVLLALVLRFKRIKGTIHLDELTQLQG